VFVSYTQKRFGKIFGYMYHHHHHLQCYSPVKWTLVSLTTALHSSYIYVYNLKHTCTHTHTLAHTHSTDWMTGFKAWQRQRTFPLASVSRPALRPAQPAIQWELWVLSPGVEHGRSVTLTTHPHLVPRSRMTRSYVTPGTCMA
jgi:hypothetical protein